MTTMEYSADDARDSTRAVPVSKGKVIVSWLTTTDHKKIGYLYLITSFIFFCVGGVMALIIRAELFEPGMQFLQTREQYNQLFTMHGTVMLLMFATPLFAGFANVMVPLQIGSPDVAFPRLNALAYWLFLFGSLVALAGFLTPQEQPHSAGSPTPRSPTRHTHQDSVGTYGFWGSRSRASARSAAASTSLRRSSACGRPV